MTKLYPSLHVALATFVFFQFGCTFSSQTSESVPDKFEDAPQDSGVLPGDIQIGGRGVGGSYLSFRREIAQAIFRKDYEAAYSLGKQAIGILRSNPGSRESVTLETIAFDEYIIESELKAGDDAAFHTQEGSVQIFTFWFATKDAEKLGTVDFEVEIADGKAASGRLVSNNDDQRVVYGEFPVDAKYSDLRERIQSVGQEVYLPIAKELAAAKALEPQSENSDPDGTAIGIDE